MPKNNKNIEKKNENEQIFTLFFSARLKSATIVLALRNEPNADITKATDTCVYGRNLSHKLPYQSKFGSDRVQIPTVNKQL